MISKHLQISAFSLKFQKFFSITRTIFSHSRSEQFWWQNTISIFFTIFFQASTGKKLWEKLLGSLLVKLVIINIFVERPGLRSFSCMKVKIQSVRYMRKWKVKVKVNHYFWQFLVPAKNKSMVARRTFCIYSSSFFLFCLSSFEGL